MNVLHVRSHRRGSEWMAERLPDMDIAGNTNAQYVDLLRIDDGAGS